MRPGLCRHHLIGFVGVVAGHFTSSASARSLPHVSCRTKINFYLNARKGVGREMQPWLQRRYRAQEFCMTCVPGAPTASPGDSLGNGESFPGRERQPRHRKSENPDNSGSSLPADRNCRSSQHLSLPESIRPEHPQKLALNRQLRKPLEVASWRQTQSRGASLRWCVAEPNRWAQPSRHARDHTLRLGASG
jgi:hypothetical protein